MQRFKQPPAIYVFVTVEPTRENGLKEPYTSRVGATNSEADIPRMIEQDRAAMRDTFGGLIDPVGTTARTYRAFRAKWSELKIA